MNAADQKIHELYQSILHLDTSLLQADKGRNYKGKLLLSLSGKYHNEIYAGELLISLNPGETELSESTISLRSMGFKSHIDPYYRRFQILHSPSRESVSVEQGRSPLYTRSADNAHKYPRAWAAGDSDSFIWHNKTHKIVIWGVNALNKLLLSPIPA